MTTGANPMLDVHPVLAGFIHRLLDGTPLIVDEVRKPGKHIGGTWRLLLSNGLWLSAWYGAGISGCYWYACIDHPPKGEEWSVNLSIWDALDALREEILKGVGE